MPPTRESRRSSLRARAEGAGLRVQAGLFCLLMAGAAAGTGQQNPPAAEMPSPLKVSTEVVSVVAIVKDKRGLLIPNLSKEDFELTEDKTPQTISYFSRETDTPLTLGILVDTSPSQGRVLSVEQEQAKTFIRQVIRPKDLAFVLHFDVEVELLQDFTNDPHLLTRAIDETAINGGGAGVMPGPFPTSGSGGATHLYDAVYLASTDLLKNEVGRKVLILLTDGEDQGSKEKLSAGLEAAQKADVTIYGVNIADRAFYYGQFGGYSGDSALKKLSEETGGRVINVDRRGNVVGAFQQIADELRTQYLLGYTSTNTAHDGTFRKIQARVHNGDYKVQVRRGYYAPSS